MKEPLIMEIKRLMSEIVVVLASMLKNMHEISFILKYKINNIVIVKKKLLI